jgi:c-di-GMP-binding flagellar brake protein YcgR
MPEEKRKFPRANVKYQINVICSGEVIQGRPQYYTFHTYTENISEGGIRVILEKEVKAGSLVKLELFISDKESLPIKCNGVVIWTKKTNPEGTKPDLFHTGIQFTNLTNPVYRKLLKDVISYYLDNKSEDKK